MMGAMELTRPVPPDPYSLLPQVPSFTLTSTDLTDGAALDPAFAQSGDNTSPHLAWSGFPAADAAGDFTPDAEPGYALDCRRPPVATPRGGRRSRSAGGPRR